MKTSEKELMKWKKSRKARSKFKRKLSVFARTCDVDTVITDDVPIPRVVCYIVFRQQPDFSISYEESLLIRGMNAPTFLVAANSVFSVFETDLSLPQFVVYYINGITDDSYDLTTVLSDASWIDIEAWTKQITIDTRSKHGHQE